MFRGVFEANLDAKGRIAVPAKMREDQYMSDSNGKIVVTVDRSRCLLLYPMTEWVKIEQQLATLSSLNPTAVKLKRFILGYASEYEIDVQGRILLPIKLRQFAELEKKVIFSGMSNKVEIWNKDSWEKTQNEYLETDLADLDQSVLDKVIL